MTDSTDISGYTYEDGELNDSHSFLLPALQTELERFDDGDKRLFDLGCGNGSIGAAVSRKGWDVTGVDVSSDGIAHANRVHPELRLETGSAYEDLAGKYGTFPVVVSLEVVEHL
uniref:class I SAM-dependent methyltransferase n=1 Tax=Roseovarius sp. TaxID=1486281 RepID=UPI0035686781